MRTIDGDALLKRVQGEEIQAQAHGREFSTCFMSPGGTPSTEWWYVEDLIENAPTIEPGPKLKFCGDCKHFHQGEPYSMCYRTPYPYIVDGEKDYCSFVDEGR